MKRDAVDELIHDHRQVQRLFLQYSALGRASRGKPTQLRKQNLFERIRRELSKHAAVEEEVIYPELRDALPDGERLAERALEEHQRMKQTLAAMGDLGVGVREFEDRMDELMSEVHDHVDDEERGILCRLPAQLGRERFLVLLDRLDSAARRDSSAKKAPHRVVAGMGIFPTDAKPRTASDVGSSEGLWLVKWRPRKCEF